MAIKQIVFDFDGTCTQIPVIYQSYADRYLDELNKRLFPPNSLTLETPTAPLITKQEWQEAQDTVRHASPKAGWTLQSTSAAPAAADPYILAYESAKFILRNRRQGRGEGEPPFESHQVSNEAHEAPWREEAKEIFETLLKKNINVYIISNSSSLKITNRLKDLLNIPKLPATMKVQSDAAKFRISELPLQKLQTLPAQTIAKFEALPAVHATANPGRPVFLRRGEYFRAICTVLGNDLAGLNETVFCGDIWEMDLAMPHALGANVHLIKRASPFDTYTYETDAVTAAGGKISDDLRAVLDWV